MMNEVTNSRKTLVCDDDKSIQQMMATMLKRAGFSVESCSEGSEALQRLRDVDYDLVVLDLMMPGVDGFAVLNYLAENKPRRLKRVIVTTAVSSSMLSGIPAGICHIMPKPFDMNEFIKQAELCAEDTLTRSRRLKLSPAPA
ncbi:MAG TPA: response regulator [Thermoanaerobaculia bacterium]|nr:response regulator [Thermoanaerobaculia bacterium]